MAKDVSEPANTGFFVLALGLLIGFVIAFVMLLSQLQVNTDLAERGGEPVDQAGSYAFYDMLPEQRVAREVVVAPTPVEPRVAANDADVQIAARTVAAPATADVTPAHSVAVEPPASSLGQASFFLEAGLFQAPDEAKRARAAILLLGLDAFILTRVDPANGIAGHHVRVGPYFDVSRLTDAKKRLRAGNVSYEIIKVTG